MKLSETKKKELDSILSELIWKTSAKCVFLVDLNGELVAIAGYTGNINTVALASLSASHFAATVALSMMLNEQQFTVLFHKGKKESIDINMVGKKMLLITIFSNKTVLGVLREETAKSIKQIEELVADVPEIDHKPKDEIKNTLREEIDNLLKDM